MSAALSALIPNIPLVAALTPSLLSACERTGPDYWAPMACPLRQPHPIFEALMLAVVIGGSATVIGSSSNLVAAGGGQATGARLGFRT